MKELGLDKTILTFRLLPKDVSVEVFAYIGEDEQVESSTALHSTKSIISSMNWPSTI